MQVLYKCTIARLPYWTLPASPREHMSETRGSPIRRDGGVGNHNGLKVKSAVRNKHDGIRLLLQHWRCATQHLPCAQFEDEQVFLQMLTQNLMNFTKRLQDLTSINSFPRAGDSMSGIPTEATEGLLSRQSRMLPPQSCGGAANLVRGAGSGGQPGWGTRAPAAL